MKMEDYFDPMFLAGKSDSFSRKQKALRYNYLMLVEAGCLPAPKHHWMIDPGGGLSGCSLSQVATTIYNAVSTSYTRSCDRRDAGGLRQILEGGGDAELWTIIRLALDEIDDEDLAIICLDRDFRAATLS